MILLYSIKIVRESLNILMDGIPTVMSVETIIFDINAIHGVNDVHDVHVWSIGSDTHALSCHISIEDIPPSESEAILRSVNQMLAAKFHIHHTTIQFENVICDIAHGCVIPVSHQHRHSERA